MSESQGGDLNHPKMVCFMEIFGFETFFGIIIFKTKLMHGNPLCSVLNVDVPIFFRLAVIRSCTAVSKLEAVKSMLLMKNALKIFKFFEGSASKLLFERSTFLNEGL